MRPTAAVAPGTAVRIATGAPLPAGADAVVQVELTTPAGRRRVPSGRAAATPLDRCRPFVLVHADPGTGTNVRLRGEDLRAGATLLRAGPRHRSGEVAIVSASGVPIVTVHRRPRVAVISTGDELRPAGTALGPAGIPDSNGPTLVALCAAAGADARHLGIAPDELGAMTQMLRRSGGLGGRGRRQRRRLVGPYDVVRPAFERVGSVALWRVAVQPGKPFAFGVADRPPGADTANTVLLLGLPGNPVSTFVTFELFVRPALRRLAGRPDSDLLRPADRAILEEPVTKAPGRRAFCASRPCGNVRAGRRCATRRAACASAWQAGRGATCSRRWRPPTVSPSCQNRWRRSRPGRRSSCWWLDRP